MRAETGEHFLSTLCQQHWPKVMNRTAQSESHFSLPRSDIVGALLFLWKQGSGCQVSVKDDCCAKLVNYQLCQPLMNNCSSEPRRLWSFTFLILQVQLACLTPQNYRYHCIFFFFSKGRNRLFVSTVTIQDMTYIFLFSIPSPPNIWWSQIPKIICRGQMSQLWLKETSSACW